MWFLVSSLICFTLITIKTIININKKSSPGVLLLSWLLLAPLTLLDFILWTLSTEPSSKRQSQQLPTITIIIFVLKLIVIALPKKLIFEASNKRVQFNIIRVQEKLKQKVLVWYFWFCLRVLAIDYRQLEVGRREEIQARVFEGLNEGMEKQEEKQIEKQVEKKERKQEPSKLIQELNLYKSNLIYQKEN